MRAWWRVRSVVTFTMLAAVGLAGFAQARDTRTDRKDAQEHGPETTTRGVLEYRMVIDPVEAHRLYVEPALSEDAVVVHGDGDDVAANLRMGLRLLGVVPGAVPGAVDPQVICPAYWCAFDDVAQLRPVCIAISDTPSAALAIVGFCPAVPVRGSP